MQAIIRCCAIIARSFLALCFLFWSYAALALTYSEPPELSPYIAFPDNVGSVAVGLNTISGHIDNVCVNSVPFCVGYGDYADAFEFTVPNGVEVTNVKLTISNFSSLLAAGYTETVSGGLSTNYIVGDFVYANILNSGNLIANSYNFRLAGDFFPCNSSITCTYDEFARYDWSLEITAVNAVPAPSALQLFASGLGMMGLVKWRRKRKKAVYSASS